jgi:cephalosporin-C deacetylase
VNGPFPLVIEYLGYSSSRGVPIGSVFAAAGGKRLGHKPGGACPVVGIRTVFRQGWVAPPLTTWIDDDYRRLFTDAFRCLQAAREMELVDPTRIAVLGHSQGMGHPWQYRNCA